GSLRRVSHSRARTRASRARQMKRQMRRAGLAAIAAVALAGCSKERTGTIAGPPLTIAPPDDAAAQEAPAKEESSPIIATFIDLSASGAPLKFRACEQIAVSVARGKATALGEKLGVGDVLLAQGAGGFDVKGEGMALVATIRPRVCEPNQATTITKQLIRATAAPELTWANGAMHAHLDVERDHATVAYMGRLEGTAPVAEHTHDTSWEILCTIDARGTVIIDGKPTRVGPRQIVAIPPGKKHSWKPDEGMKLVAIQFYSPPGPEQRFKTLAGVDAN
ncbi:MAG: cupin domain-containing protein, partial [Polyangiaceae bacterium]